jgi:hypothetical protein
MVPFSLAMLVALLAPLVSTGFGTAYARDTSIFFDNYLPLSPVEYQEHIAFQLSFSELPLGREGEGIYLRYRRGADGFIEEYPFAGDSNGFESLSLVLEEELPPFPLSDLMGFLGGEKHHYAPVYTYSLREYIFVPALLFLGVPALFNLGRNHRKKKRYVVYNDKRIAA